MKQEHMPVEESIKVYIFTEKESASFRSVTEKQGTSDWITVRHFFAGGSTGNGILVEALLNLDQGTCTYDLEDLLGIKVKGADEIEAEVTHDGMVDVNDKSTLLSNNAKYIIKKYQLTA